MLPISFFERSGQAYYNSITVADADGTLLGTYRRAIPDGPGYTEKFYFAPGDTGVSGTPASRAWVSASAQDHGTDAPAR